MSSKEEWKSRALQLASCGNSWREIARTLNVAKSTVSDFLRKTTTKQMPQDNLPSNSPKVLLVDVENAPYTAYVWQRWKANIGQDQSIQDGYLLSFSAKWLGGDTIIFERITEFENDDKIVHSLYELFNQADVIVAHNGKKFDEPLIKARFLKHGLVPPAPYKMVDTLQIAKKNFRFPSNSLDSIAAYLGLERKKKHEGFTLWTRCMNLEEEAFNEMQEYNEQDIIVLEQVYLKLRAWDNQSPNLGLYYKDGKSHCVCCGSSNLHEIEKSSYTALSEFETVKCSDCGKMQRRRVNLRSKEDMGKTLTNVM